MSSRKPLCVVEGMQTMYLCTIVTENTLISDIQLLVSINIYRSSRKDLFFCCTKHQKELFSSSHNWNSCLLCLAFFPISKSFFFVVSDVLQFPDSIQNTIFTFKSISTTACRQTEGNSATGKTIHSVIRKPFQNCEKQQRSCWK